MATIGVSNYHKYLMAFSIATISGLKCAIYTSNSTINANAATTSPQAYTAIAELSASETGYTTGGFTLSGGVVTQSGNSFRVEWNDFATAAGTISAGTYYGLIYNPADSNRGLAVCTINVTQGSVAGVMTFSLPADLISIS